MYTFRKIIIIFAICFLSVAIIPVNAQQPSPLITNINLSRFVVFEGFYNPA